MIGAAVWRALSKGTCTYTPLVPWLRRVQTTYAGGPSRAGQSFWYFGLVSGSRTLSSTSSFLTLSTKDYLHPSPSPLF
ncbi:hypothetical protein VDGE_30508 [Verticillium dahliae]|uniref:Uncharacterized protein n=1 Tax=Verticillium dahliae TaxID=27337 RepID=A0A444S9C3_VERDA|nr:hypothetical protein VDGE_30508 [Verticillium dahliae]